jgi:hypothetical protein
MADHLQAALPAQSAGGATVATVVGEVSGSGGTDNFVTRMSLTLAAGASTVTGAATNNVTFSFRQIRAGSVVQTLGSVTLASGTNLVAETPLVVAVSGAASTMQAGDLVDVQMVQNGTGLAVPAGVVASVDIA